MELKSSDLEQKKEKLKGVQELIEVCRANAADWRQLVKRLKQWEESEVINEYLSNPLLHRMDEIAEGKINAAELPDIIASGDRSRAGATARPHHCSDNSYHELFLPCYRSFLFFHSHIQTVHRSSHQNS